MEEIQLGVGGQVVSLAAAFIALSILTIGSLTLAKSMCDIAYRRQPEPTARKTITGKRQYLFKSDGEKLRTMTTNYPRMIRKLYLGVFVFLLLPIAVPALPLLLSLDYAFGVVPVTNYSVFYDMLCLFMLCFYAMYVVSKLSLMKEEAMRLHRKDDLAPNLP